MRATKPTSYDFTEAADRLIAESSGGTLPDRLEDPEVIGKLASILLADDAEKAERPRRERAA